MQAVYYRTRSGRVPARESLNEYLGRRTTKNPDDLVAKISFAISYALEKNGVPGGGISAPLEHWKPLREIKINRGMYKIRINYFCYVNQIVLFNFYVKKHEYSPRGPEARKVDRMIQEAWSYYKDFIINPSQYEKYQ